MQVWLCQKMHLVTSVPNSHAWINTCVLLVSVHVCARTHEEQELTLVSSSIVFHHSFETWNSRIWSDWLTNELLQSIYPHLPCLGTRRPAFTGARTQTQVSTLSWEALYLLDHLYSHPSTFKRLSLHQIWKGIMIKAGEGLGKKLNGSGLRRVNWSCGYDQNTLYLCMKLSMSKLSNIKRIMMWINEWAALTRETSHIYAFGFLKQPFLRDSVTWCLRKIKAERLWGKCPIPFRLLAAKVAPKLSYLAPQPCNYPALWKERGLWGFHFEWLVCNFSWDLWQYFQTSLTELVAQDAAGCELPRMQQGFSMAWRCEQGVLVGALPFTGNALRLTYSCLV